ncbi:hypothetical protein J19TS2_17470 [Cohnella xylanilytica]|uniref:Helix-turn-helix transcriptional regulator n=1 Tax=Cohnella xylanilytica TaxID=557555 RepID=A0A841TNW9_9BACL|nr:helix-turn-helix transcriptional regulator [Cohnella xylanilytica]MBB6690026.1 helix-turn-helix transcriptional regulator [Cohnella xylanilytica]GIO12192.1 hypothetical protein J19TS2_17470 [Cohnella xylanilytica]
MVNANISGPRIKQIREQLKMDQVELAAALDVEFGIRLKQSDISEIERGARGVKDYELNAISKILNVDPTWLLRGTN